VFHIIPPCCFKASPSPYRFPFLIDDLDGSNILKPDSNKGGEVGRFFLRIQDPKAATTYSSPLLYKKIVVLTNALVCTTNLSMFLMNLVEYFPIGVLCQPSLHVAYIHVQRWNRSYFGATSCFLFN
jgi:hypothetical protein